MSTAQFTCPLIVVIPGQVIAASLWNGEFQNIFNNGNPLGIGAYSDTDPQMQTSTDPFPGGTSRPTSLGGELERIRYIFALITGNTYWYQHPVISLNTVNTNITSLQGRFPVNTVDIANNAITGPKIASNSVTSVNIVDANITTNKIADGNINESKLSISVAGNGLSGGGGAALSVNTDNSTIEINSDTLRVKDAGITSSKLAAGIIHGPLTNVSSQITASSANGIFVSAFSYSGSGALKGITLTSARNGGTSGSATFTIRITLDGVAYTVGSLLSNNSNKYSIVPDISWSGNNPPVFSGAFKSNAVAGSLADFYIGFKTSLLIELRSDSFSDGLNSFYACTSYEA